jgi:hypothetical protein
LLRHVAAALIEINWSAGTQRGERLSGKSHKLQVNRAAQKYFALLEFGFIVCIVHPSPPKGRSYVVTNAGWVAVDASSASARMWAAGRAED